MPTQSVKVPVKKALVYSVTNFDPEYFIGLYRFKAISNVKPITITTPDLLHTLNCIEQKAEHENPGSFYTLASLYVLGSNNWVDLTIQFESQKDLTELQRHKYLNLTPTDQPYWALQLCLAGKNTSETPVPLVDRYISEFNENDSVERLLLYARVKPFARENILSQDSDLTKVWYQQPDLSEDFCTSKGLRKVYKDGKLLLPEDAIVINDGTQEIDLN